MTTKLSDEENGITDATRINARERLCLSMTSEGQTPKEIAYILAMTEEGVELHRKSIEKKLNATSRVEAVAIAIRHNIL